MLSVYAHRLAQPARIDDLIERFDCVAREGIGHSGRAKARPGMTEGGRATYLEEI
jgi:hypothetical protein